MLQDGSFSLNHRLPAFSVFRLALHRIIPSYVVLSSVSSFPLVISSLRPSRRRLHLHDRFPSSRQLGNLPHAYAAATLSLSLILSSSFVTILNLASTTIELDGIAKYRSSNGLQKIFVPESICLKKLYFMRLMLKLIYLHYQIYLCYIYLLK